MNEGPRKRVPDAIADVAVDEQAQTGHQIGLAEQHQVVLFGEAIEQQAQASGVVDAVRCEDAMRVDTLDLYHAKQRNEYIR